MNPRSPATWLPRPATVRLALDAIQRTSGDGDARSESGSKAHRAWIARIDAIEQALHRAIAREAQ